MTPREMIVWIVALMLVAAVLLAPVACTVHRQKTVAQAIRNGADPIAAKCAIESDMQQSTMCVLAASKR